MIFSTLVFRTGSMANIKEYIASCGETPAGERPKVGRFKLRRAIRKYPWFTTARIIRASQYDYEDERVYLAQLFPICTTQSNDDASLREEIENKVVDRFLSLGIYAISHSEEDGGAESLISDLSDNEDDDEFYTEELAQIYEKQGLFEEARKIYVKLGLLYPKKSVYFAEIISRLDEKKL